MEELKEFLTTFGEKFTDAEFRKMKEHVNKEGTGLILCEGSILQIKFRMILNIKYFISDLCNNLFNFSEVIND